MNEIQIIRICFSPNLVFDCLGWTMTNFENKISSFFSVGNERRSFVRDKDLIEHDRGCRKRVNSGKRNQKCESRR